ncbi:MAG: disulfide bond formation protein B [archaeon]
MTEADIINSLLSTLTLIGDITIGLIILLGILKAATRSKTIDALWDFVRKHALMLAFIVAITATAGSLSYSEILGYAPCELCWFQRIFMYPLVLVLGAGLLRRDPGVRSYAIPMAFIGALFAGYQYIIQHITYAATCSADGTSCTVKYVFHYGYITISMMALSAFVLIMLLTAIRQGKKAPSPQKQLKEFS